MTKGARLQRLDIQALRGLAVLLVVFYHAKIGAVTAGYLGVDIFFVISGYLITQLVAGGIYRGDFSLRQFYFRRAKRLLPAAYTTFAVTVALAPWFLNQQELRDFVTQLIGAVTFTGNFVLWQQTGYFEGAGDVKPLLHIWSLALEEQYYFLLPAILLFTRPTRWLSGAIVLIVLSFGLCLVCGMVKPIAAFYLLPTRAWELLIGSAGALWVSRTDINIAKHHKLHFSLLFIAALLCLLLLPFFPFTGPHPGLNAVLICLATLIIIVRNSPALNAALPSRWLAKIGDFSYSLYLVHWPIIAFMKNAWAGSSAEVPLHLRCVTLLLSFILAWLLYHLIENPIRKSHLSLSKSLIGKLALCSTLLVSITPMAIYAMPFQINFKQARQHNYGFAPSCAYKTTFSNNPQCHSSSAPDLMIWGDSYAMHLVPGLAQAWKSGGVIQATRSQCAAFLGMAPKNVNQGDGPVYNQAWAESCIRFNESVIAFLRISPLIKTVVLSSPLSQYVDRDNYEHVLQKGNAFISSPPDMNNAVASLRQTVTQIRALGKKVILIAPPPSLDFNIGACLERQLSGAIAIGARPGCLIERAEYEAKRANVLAFLKVVERDLSLPVIRFEPWLCDATTCQTMLDGTMIYRDGGHLSIEGSKVMVKRMQMEKLIAQLAK